MFKKILMIILLFFFVFTFSVSVDGKTIYVDDDGTVDYTSIQSAINAASNGDTIEVNEGNYYENIVINKSINIIGEHNPSEDKLSCIYNENNENAVTILSNNVNFSGFYIENKYERFGITGEFINDINIFNNSIEQETDGIHFENFYNINISNNVISNFGRAGIRLAGSNQSNSIVMNNKIKNSKADGISIVDSNDIIIKNNQIIENEKGIGVLDSFSILISNNTIISNINAIKLIKTSDVIIINNDILDNKKTGIILHRTDTTQIELNNIKNNLVGINISKYCSDNKISNNNIFLDNNVDIYGKHIENKDVYEFFSFMSYIFLFFAIIYTITMYILQGKIFSILKNKHSEEFNKLPKNGEGKILRIKANWHILRNRIKPGSDNSLKKYILFFKGAWIVGIIILLTLLVILLILVFL